MAIAQTAALNRETLSSVADPVWQVEVDRVSPAEWSSMLDLFDDANIYQTWSYGAVRWGTKNLSHLVLKRDGEVVGVAQLRIIRPTSLKFGMAYLRWGPVCQRTGAEPDPEIGRQLARALEKEYVTTRGLYLHVLPNAFVESARGELFRSTFSSFNFDRPSTANTYRTFLLDLTPPLDDLRRKLDPKWRNKLAGAEKNGLKVIAGRDSENYRTFCRMYRQMRNRKTFETTVDIDEFGRIQKDLFPNQQLQILICEQAGVPVAGIVATAMGDSAIYLLGATSDDGLKAKGSYLLQWSLIQQLKQQGIRWYDLGGIDPDLNPGVYQFKRGLSGTDVFQLPPIVACNSLLSSAVVKTGLTLQKAVRVVGALSFFGSLRQLLGRD